MKTLLVSLCVGLIIGFVAQRSRFCLIGGVRDYMIVKDTYLIKGFFGLLLTAAVLFYVFHLTGSFDEAMPNYPQFMKGNSITVDQDYSACACTNSPQFVLKNPDGGYEFNWNGIQFNALMLCTILGAFVIGVLSVLIGGCPLRQHVKAASGNKSAMVYVLGFYVGVIIYMAFLNGFFKVLFEPA
ncbi:MAG: YeeE/YedE thiosulfate transporter family protein [Clostridia bacterium]|nr:YeeE/YedE thiosulfate transporter family protein [Clostridia bacterium]